MRAFVRKGYVVFDGVRRYEEGVEIPPSIIATVVANQSWKIEVQNGKQKGKESTESKKEPAETAGSDREEEGEITDSVINRMMKFKETKKR